MNRTAEIEAQLREGGRLRVVFDWEDDRFVHRVDWWPSAEARDATTLLRSVEREGGDWPCSPPFQQVEFCSLAEGRDAILGVGMAGTSHWSLAVEVEPQQLVFDVACRLHEPPTYLGSAYALANRPDDQRRWLQGDFEAGLSARAQTELRWCPDDLDAGEYESPRAVLCPTTTTPGSFPATVRWQYVVWHRHLG